MDSLSISFSVVVVAVLALASLYVVYRRISERLEEAYRRNELLSRTLTKERERFSELRPASAESGRDVDHESQTGVVPEVPTLLLKAAVENDVVLVLGGGASAQASLPTAEAFWLCIIDEIGKDLDESTREILQVAIASGDKLPIETLLAKAGRDRLIQAAKRILTLPAGAGLPELHQILRKGEWASAIGLTWDELDLATFVPRGFALIRAEDSPDFAELLRSGRPVLIKPIGDTARPETIALTWQDYRQVLERWPDLVHCLATLYTTRTLLFIGLSLDSVEQFVNGLPSRVTPQRTHYALVPADRMNAVWQLGIGSRFNITLIEMVPTTGYPELPAFMRNLVDSAQVERRAQGTPSVVKTRAPELKRLHLENIGLYENLDMDFPKNWTVLLGINGCGKSTVLKAIGLALCGVEPRAEGAAQRLLRRASDVKTGRIELTIGGEQVVVELIRERGQVRVHGPPITPVQARTVLAIGSPALRGVATRHPSGYAPMAKLDPSTDDLLPLVRDPYDTRLDSFMQWALNAKIASDRDPNCADAAMVCTLEKLIGALVPPHPLRFVVEGRESRGLELHVDTGEVTVPFESISQGMSSIFNWVGLLLQRLYDVFPNSPHPELEPALILIDEIDAHLHPDWQRRLVALVQENFPNVQVIATSHSPLVAGALGRDEIRILRNGNAYEPSEDMKGMSVQDVMMSSSFSMRSPRATPGEKIISRYLELFAKPERSNPEETEFQELAGKFGELRYGTSEREDRIRKAVYQVLRQESPEKTDLDSETRLLIEKELGAASVHLPAGDE